MDSLRVLGLAVTCSCLVACGAEDAGPRQTPGGTAVASGNGAQSGGATGTGGPAPTTGGNPGTGAVSAGTEGGVQATGGNGGTTTGAGATGEAATGGGATSGAATGGGATGGGMTGEAATGGVETGGVETGGAATGGTATDGGAIGGSPTAGVQTGGASPGGAEAGVGGDTGSGTSGSPGAGGGSTTDSAPSPGCGSPTGLSSGNGSIDVNGTTREYILSIPDNYDPSQPYRLVFGWHQLAGTADLIARMGYYGVEGPSAGQAILVAPQGLYQITPSSGNLDAGWWNNSGEDVDFYFAMLDRFSSELCIDQNRIFSIGFSFGAMFSFTLACTEGSMTRAIAPQAGGGGGCNQRVAVMGFVGTSDGLLSGHVQAVESFATPNGCSGDPVQMQPSWCDDINDPTCICVEYQNCDDGYPVVSCEYDNGHLFAPNSGQAIWDFFSQL